MEVVGRFPMSEESSHLKIHQNTPVWLPAGNEELSGGVNDKMKSLRDYAN